MKFLLILTVLIVSTYLCVASTNGTCRWQEKRNSLVAQLSPTGQQAANKLISQIQLYTGAAIQPLYEYITQKYASFLKSLNAQDNQKLTQLSNLL